MLPQAAPSPYERSSRGSQADPGHSISRSSSEHLKIGDMLFTEGELELFKGLRENQGVICPYILVGRYGRPNALKLP